MESDSSAHMKKAPATNINLKNSQMFDDIVYINIYGYTNILIEYKS